MSRASFVLVLAAVGLAAACGGSSEGGGEAKAGSAAAGAPAGWLERFKATCLATPAWATEFATRNGRPPRVAVGTAVIPSADLPQVDLGPVRSDLEEALLNRKDMDLAANPSALGQIESMRSMAGNDSGAAESAPTGPDFVVFPFVGLPSAKAAPPEEAAVPAEGEASPADTAPAQTIGGIRLIDGVSGNVVCGVEEPFGS